MRKCHARWKLLKRYVSHVSSKPLVNMQRYTQSQHAHTLTQQSLAHVRSELSTLRKTTNRQSLQLATGAGIEDQLYDMSRRYDEAREMAEGETKRAKEEGRKLRRAEARIGALVGG